MSRLLRRSVRNARALPRRDKWHSLQEYASGEGAEEFRHLRIRDSKVAATIASAGKAKTIDWANWESRVSNQEVVSCLKDFHTQQSELLDAVIAEDHKAAVAGQTAGWELFDSAVDSCKKSVEKSEAIWRNGARALWISFHNPPISQVTQSEWLDTDQYWQAFVEKHHFYHNHLCSAVEDPESKEWDLKQKDELVARWNLMDGKGTTRLSNKLLYQRPSFEYYDLYRGPLIEHMIFYLTKTGGDARFFPQNMPVQWFAEIYNIRFNLYNVLARRKKLSSEASLARVTTMDFHPEDLDHDGEAHWAKLIATESASTELAAARLMGNFILFSDEYIPVQSGHAFYAALQSDGAKGTFHSLGSDVHCLFYKPAGGVTMPDPVECFHSLADYATMTGRRFEPGYAEASENFCHVLESRKAGLGGQWLTAPGESTKDAFMRRLKTADPSHHIYEAYSEEWEQRWTGAKALSMDEALAEIPEIERKYHLECSEYQNVIYGLNEEFSAESKLEHEQLTKLSETGNLQASLDSGSLVAIASGEVVTDAAAVIASLDAFEANRDKIVEVILAQKSAADKR